ncbi:hypothetical protein [Larkinella rosea]|uniref:hypothetical protein n=1 Tax=Larkinella rosea TaxID=2025312 RepID=UPI001E3B1E1E|nr:hypothetical protein [Larkinella rosea]
MDPANQEIEIYALEGGFYKLFSAISAVKREVVSKQLSGFERAVCLSSVILFINFGVSTPGLFLFFSSASLRHSSISSN